MHGRAVLIAFLATLGVPAAAVAADAWHGEIRCGIVAGLNTKPLVDALVQVGVPRHCIVLSYAGETINDAA